MLFGNGVQTAMRNILLLLTMRFPDEHNLEEIRLGFVIVDNTKRGRGYGKEMLFCKENI